ncbi:MULTISPECIES: elongation factor 1-beta [Methanosarcina]|jgi:elongation factor 1-beta|uniref:Elongation factor 1-beta n=3 Tax=Methanosarcina barkeri TaxID=2208 RepID=A0A0E3QU89_METBA|nr:MULTISPECIES: elongation factor 1-beta [Methanosarcina]AKB54193.1 Translation elongation factor 1 beta subunit [Methanosarcina barkeri MS]AKB57731.1 Translation elongation factor 1 beta subunit [Methanosarcina barkeri 227]AKJ38272.1 translation elongation factor aEF-1 beta [Methanosarcina barkeri CM1]OED06425.1 elongation factor 1-beta [Methanosarcina sp. A14]
MGDVAAKIKIMPESVDTDLGELKGKIKGVIPAGADLHGDIVEEPIAFGLNALIVTLIVNDEEGGTEPAEEAFAKVSGVENVQVVDVYRI